MIPIADFVYGTTAVRILYNTGAGSKQNMNTCCDVATTRRALRVLNTNQIRAVIFVSLCSNVVHRSHTLIGPNGPKPTAVNFVDFNGH